MKKILFTIALCLMVAACGNNSGDSRTGGGSVSQTTAAQSAIEATISKRADPMGEEVSVAYTITTPEGTQASGVIDFGDGTRERIAGDGTATHLYPNAGIYAIVIQVGGEAGVEIGTVTINRGGSPVCPPDVEISSGNCSVAG